MVKKIFAAMLVLCCCMYSFTIVRAADRDPVSGKCSGIGAANMPSAKSVGEIETVACFYGAMPTGVTVSHQGRIFVNFPRWGDKVDFTVAEVKAGKVVPYPNADINRPDKNKAGKTLVSVQSVVVDPSNRLWLLDTGRIKFGPPWPGGPKLVGVDLKSNNIFKMIPIPEDVALPSTYLNDVRFDLSRGKAGMAFITDSSGSDPGIIVVDLASGKSWRRLGDHKSVKPLPHFLPIVEGRPLMRRLPGKKPSAFLVGADGIAIGADGKRLYYCPLSSWSLFSVSVDALADPNMSDSQVADTVRHEGYKVASDGLESDSEKNVYVTGYDQNAILRRASDNSYETIAYGTRILWPDTLSLATDGYLYFTANQLHRQAIFHGGKDLREKPYMLFRIKVDKKPVLLK
jgi:sugar lactone lactonase YvrE